MSKDGKAQGDWRERLAGSVRAQASGGAGGPAQADGAALAPHFDAARARLEEAITDVASRAGVTVPLEPDEAGRRLRWTFLTRALVLRLDPDGGRFVLSVTADRDYLHAEFWLEGGSLLSMHEDRVARPDWDELARRFVSRLFVDPEEQP